jgi:hypothetical protein
MLWKSVVAISRNLIDAEKPSPDESGILLHSLRSKRYSGQQEQLQN